MGGASGIWCGRIELHPARLAAALCLATSILIAPSLFAARSRQQQFIDSVSRDILELKKGYAQLADFSVTAHSDMANLTVSYQFHTHRADHAGGWTTGVPNPDPDGLWFYIDVHDPKSIAQIHTQPATVPLCLGPDRVSFLMLEGSRTKPLRAAIWTILANRGATRCRRE